MKIMSGKSYRPKVKLHLLYWAILKSCGTMVGNQKQKISIGSNYQENNESQLPFLDTLRKVGMQTRRPIMNPLRHFVSPSLNAAADASGQKELLVAGIKDHTAMTIGMNCPKRSKMLLLLWVTTVIFGIATE
ncbi:hypothetical protein ACHAWF_006306 [Thalassiosira exigua]